MPGNLPGRVGRESHPTPPTGRRDGLLPVACWCERRMRPLTEDEVWKGTGWRCGHHHCLPEGLLYMKMRRAEALAESWRLRGVTHEMATAS